MTSDRGVTGRIVGMAARFNDFQASELLQPDINRIFYRDIIRIYIYIIITMGFIKFITQQYVNWYVLKKCHPTIGILIYCGCMMLQGGAPPVMLVGL